MMNDGHCNIFSRKSGVFISVLAIGILISFCLKGQNLAFDHITVESGLSQNSVLAIAQDSSGFMWFGTRYGLNRYDGHNFKIFQTDTSKLTSISDNYITTLLCDSKHNLWIGTGHGLNKFNARNNTFEHFYFNQKLNSQANSIICIFEDTQGHIWAGTWDGLYLLKKDQKESFKSFKLSPLKNNAANTIHAIYQDNDGFFWIGSSTGLYRLNIKNGSYLKQGPVNLAPINNNFITSIVGDKQNRIWIGTQNDGLDLYQKSSQSFSHFTHADGLVSNNIRRIIIDKTGRLWLATLEGLSVFNPKNKSFISYTHDSENKKSLNQNSIYSLLQDANGSVWVGTYYGGVNITYPYTTAFNIFQTNKYQSSISHNVISQISEDEHQNLYIGTEGGGLNYFDRKNNSFIIYKNKPNDSTSIGSDLVKAVYRDNKGNIWVGTHGGGLNLFDPVKRNFKHILFRAHDAETLSAEITSIIEDTHGYLWVGTQSGLKIFDITRKSVQLFSNNIIPGKVSGESVKSLFQDSNKNMWVGTMNGLYVLPNNGTEFKHLSHNYINCIQQDSAGHMWIGYYYGGLAQYNPVKQTFIVYTTKNGLPNNNIIGIQQGNNNNLWLSTDNGLSRFDLNNKTFKNYTTSDGIASNDFNYNSFYKASNGEMFFGGHNGLTSFFPDKLETNSYIAPVVFTDLKLFNIPVEINNKTDLLKQDINSTKNLAFRYNQNVFTIEFALLNYIKSNKNRYAYKLEGFDKDWNYITTSAATYTNLPAGDYVFLVKGANNDGFWSKTAKLNIKVLPPFWKTLLAYFLYIIVFAAILFFVIRFFFLRALLKQEHELTLMKLNFFTNISHEIRTHLSLILGPVEKLIYLNENDIKTNQQLLHVKNNADRLLKLVNELMDFRKVESGNLNLHISQENIVSFLYDIYSSFLELSVSKNIKANFLCEADDIEIYFDKEQMGKVFFNLLSNAYKFTPDGGYIKILIKQTTATAEIKVIDNGKGIANPNLEKLFDNYYQENDYGAQNTGYGIGLAFSKSIIASHKGEIHVESEHLGGENITCFNVTLLKGNKHFDKKQLLPLETVFETTAVLSEVEHLGIGLFEEACEFNEDTYTVLLVEDNPEVRAFISESLKTKYHVLQGINGINGLEMATENIPDLIISDVMMPEMDGFTFCNRLKTDERTSHIPVILLTAQTSTVNQVNGLEMGADIYLTKPFSIRVLELQISNLLRSRENMRQKFSQQVTLQPQNIPLNTIDEQFLNKIMQLVETHFEDPNFGVSTLALQIGMSKPVLYKKLKALTNLSVNDFIKSIRLYKASQLLQQKKFTVYEIAYNVGYNDIKHFRQEFKKQFGKTPTEYIKAK